MAFILLLYEHTEIDEHLEEIDENVIVEHMFYTISIATNNRTPGIFSTALIVKRVWLLGTREYVCRTVTNYQYVLVWP